MDKLAIRPAAERARLSTQPFFTLFINIDTFKTAVLEYIADLYLDEAGKNIIRSVPVISYALYINDYALEHPNLYNALIHDGFFKKEKYHNWIEKVVVQQSERSDNVRDFLIWIHGKILTEGPKNPTQLVHEIRDLEGFPTVPKHFHYVENEM